MPIYRVRTEVKHKGADGTPVITFADRMVEARNKAQAISHIVDDSVTAEALDAKEAVRLCRDGIDIEQAANGAA